jgi:multidrug efflux pump subunit AcrA (membrane-fusion protein)
VVGVDQEGSRVSDVLVRAGEMVTENQELARLTPPPAQAGARSSSPTSLRAPAAGLVTEVRTVVGAPASPQAGPMFRLAINSEIELDAEVPAVHILKLNPGATVRISRDNAPDLVGRVRLVSPQAGPMFRLAINNEIELDAEVPAVHILKLNPGATVRISRDNAPDLVGRVRLVSPQIDRATQLGHVRISLASNPSLKVGMFARANIDAKRSCGVAIPHTAIDHLTVQVVKDNTVETRHVRVGLVSDTSTEILEGLDVGEIVVADAGSSLHDGDRIKTMFAEDLDRTRVR